MHILHGPANVGNQPWTLSRAERSLGHESNVVENYGTWIGYPADRTLTKYAKDTAHARLVRAFFGLVAPFRYDVVHYYFGRSFMLWDDFGMALGRSAKEDARCLRDVKLARLMGRRTIMTLQGCDVRQAGVSNRSNAVTMCKPDGCPAYETCISKIDETRRAMVDTLLPLMDRVFYLNPELGHLVPQGEFLPYANFDIAGETVALPKASGRLRILHAPSNGGIKGTPHILAALERLRAQFDFELVVVENTPHSEALKLYRSADLVIDQALAGWYGGFAVELMAMGKPVAAYIRDEDRRFVPELMWEQLPIIRIHPDSIEGDLARVLAAPAELQTLGVRSRAFVERWHDPLKIARALEAVYRDAAAPLAIAA